jgi:hypothetical protein
VGADHEANMAICFVESGLAVMGNADLVRQAVDAGGRGMSVKANADLMTRVAKMGTDGVWAVGRFDSIASRAKLPDEVTGRIPPITWFAASGHINGGMRAMLEVETQTPEAAANLGDIVRGFTALAKMSAGNRPELQALWPEIVPNVAGNTVSVSFTVSSALLDALTAAGEVNRKSLQKRD